MNHIRINSPHLSIYKPQFNSVLSIFNRISGVILLVFLLGISFNSILSDILWVYSSYSFFYSIVSYFSVQINSFMLFIFLLSFYYHLIINLDQLGTYTHSNKESSENGFFRPLEFYILDEFNLNQLYVNFSFKLGFSIFLTLFTFILL